MDRDRNICQADRKDGCDIKIIEPSVEIITPIDYDAIMQHLEACGRTCYKSEHKTGPGSAERLVRNLIKRGHESVLEHYSFTVRWIVDRAISHQIVRHRIASYSQESQRYCSYIKDAFGGNVTFIRPVQIEPGTPAYTIWESMMQRCECAYFDMLALGCSPQAARSVLPNSTKTELMMTANIREWRHFLKLRTSAGADPNMRYIAGQLLTVFKTVMPALFDDIERPDDDIEQKGV